MPAPYAEERAKLCQHERFTTCCPACLLVEQVIDLAEAQSEQPSAVAYCQSMQYQLDHATNEQEREDAQISLEQAQTFVTKWDSRIESIESDLVDSRAAVKAICDANEPKTLARAFAEIAEEEMAKEKDLWHTAMGEELDPFVDADPDFEANLRPT